MRALVAALAAVLAAGSAASAQPARGGPGRREAREELFRMVDAYVVSTLQESLGLTDGQFARLLPAVRRLQSTRRDFAEKRRDTLAEIRQVLASGTGTDARVADLMGRLRTMERDEPVAVRKEADAVDAQLTPVQQAKLRLMESRIEQRLRELVRRGRGAGPRGRGQGEDSETP